MNKKNVVPVILAFIVGGIASTLLAPMFSGGSSDSSEKKPLYWVAPMDANFRRDGPGKSPMGMDLVPVYEEDASSSDEPAGTVTINSQIENQLGVKTEKVTQGQLERALEVAGFLQYDDTGVQHYHSRTSGWVEKLYVYSVGDEIKKGQKLYELYSPELVYAQEELVGALQTGNQALLQSSRLKLQALGVSTKQIRQLENHKKVKQRLSFHAQKSGYVSELNVREGMYIQPSVEILASADLSRIWVIAEVFESQWPWLQTGLNVSMNVNAIANRTWQGKVDYIYPNINAMNRTQQVRVVFDNQDLTLKPNMFANLTIETQALSETLLVPNDAVIDTGKSQRVVLALGNGQYRSVDVKTGLQGAQQTQILSGVKEGDTVVTSAQFLIDSESNAQAELARMNTPEPESVDRVWVHGKINQIKNNALNLQHDPVDKWQWPAMTMDLSIQKDLNLDDYQAGDVIGFCLDKFSNNEYVITHIEKAQRDEAPHFFGEMNHEGMKHEGMNHEGMHHD